VKRKATLAAILLAGLSLSACSNSTTGSGTPSPGFSAPDSPTGASSPALVAPTVSNPLDVSKFEKSPCGLLSAAQANQILTVTKTDVTPGATDNPICGWENDSHDSLSIGLIGGNGGLSTVYRQHRADSPGYFIPIPDIGGYPALFASVADLRSKGSCTLAVGVRDDEVMNLNMDYVLPAPGQGDPCQLAQKAAGLAVVTLKGGS
jgi:Protein of unknown function (DUF3558)